MRRMLLVAVSPVIVLAATGCSGRIVTPTNSSSQAYAVVVPSPPSPLGSETPIAIGQTMAFTIHAGDPYCAETDPDGTLLAPCQRYLVTVPGSGVLTVRVQWNTADSLLNVEGREPPAGPIAAGGCCSSPMDARFTVSAGSPFLIFVQWEGNRSTASLPPDATQDFTLTASFKAGDASERISR